MPDEPAFHPVRVERRSPTSRPTGPRLAAEVVAAVHAALGAELYRGVAEELDTVVGSMTARLEFDGDQRVTGIRRLLVDGAEVAASEALFAALTEIASPLFTASPLDRLRALDVRIHDGALRTTPEPYAEF